MKKVLAVVFTAIMSVSVFAGPLGNLGKGLLSSDEAKPATGTLPDNVELLPVVWNLLYA